MKKIWYIKINGKQKGPYTVDQLKRIKEITPDTLAWSVELKAWIPIREIPELQEIFKDPKSSEEEEDENEEFTQKRKKYAGELVLEMPAPPPLTFWLWVALAVVIFIILHLFNER